MTYECSDAPFGQHRPEGARGECHWCGARIGSWQDRELARTEQDPLSIDPDESSYYEE